MHAVQREPFAEPGFYWSYYETVNRARPRSRFQGKEGKPEALQAAPGTASGAAGVTDVGICSTGMLSQGWHHSKESRPAPGLHPPASGLWVNHTGIFNPMGTE